MELEIAMRDPKLLAALEEVLSQAKKQAEAAEPLRQLWESYCRDKRREYKACVHWWLMDTVVEYDGAERPMGDVPWNALNQRVIESWRTRVRRRDRSGRIKDRPLKAATRNVTLNKLRGCLTYHWKDGRISFHPLRGIAAEDERDSERVGHFSPDQFELFVSCCHPMLGKMLTLSAHCGGLRNKEVRKLKKCDVDWHARELIIRSRDHKNGNEKRILLTDDMYQMLLVQRASVPGEYLFPSPSSDSDKPWSPGAIDYWMRKARRRSGIQLMGEAPVFHHTRHTWYAWGSAKGIAMEWLMDQAGHRSSRIAKRYAKLGGANRERMRALMNAPVPAPAAPGTLTCPVCGVSHQDVPALAKCIEAHVPRR